MLVRLGMRQDISTMQLRQITIVKLEVGVKYTTILHLNLTVLYSQACGWEALYQSFCK